MPTRSATTTWSGGLQDGSGRVELTSSKVGSYDVSFPRRAADDAEGVTSPEELIAAAHSACYAMQFSALLGEAGGKDISLDVSADVTLAPGPRRRVPDQRHRAARPRRRDRRGRRDVRERGRGREERLPGEQGAQRDDDHPGRAGLTVRHLRWSTATRRRAAARRRGHVRQDQGLP